MIKKFYLLIFLLILQIYPCYADISVFFTPSKKCETSIIQCINNAKKSIDIAIYAINNKNIVDAIKEAHNRGIKVRILTDKLQAANKKSRAYDLYKYGIKIRINSKYKIEHNKFAIFDSDNVVTGSYNWTESASNKNSENCLFVNHNKKIIKEYRNRFNYLWQINTKKKSDLWFNRYNKPKI